MHMEIDETKMSIRNDYKSSQSLVVGRNLLEKIAASRSRSLSAFVVNITQTALCQ